MDVGKSSTISQIEEEMNFPMSKMQSTEIKESIRITESNILPEIKELKTQESIFKKASEKDKQNDENQEKSNEKSKEKSSEKLKKTKDENEESEENFDPILILNDKNNNKIHEERSLLISSNKEEDSKIIHEKLEDDESKNLGKYLNFVKKNRKQVNLEAQILANRIALLKQEELKTVKKIKETKNKADEIYRLKRQNYEKNQEVEINIELF